jgi:hypothetical protein
LRPGFTSPAFGVVTAGVLAVCVLGAAVPTSAQSRAAAVLRSGGDFRARVRAALHLGESRDRSYVPLLVSTLEDGNASVRAASAHALGEIGDPGAVAGLEGLLRDRSRTVRQEARRALRRIQATHRRPARDAADATLPDPRRIPWARVRHVVSIGALREGSQLGDPRLLHALRTMILGQLRGVRGVAVLDGSGSVSAAVRRVIRRRRLPHLRIEGGVERCTVSHPTGQTMVRCAVALQLLDSDSAALRSVLNGAASVTSSSPRASQRAIAQLALRAVETATQSAMRSADQALRSVR